MRSDGSRKDRYWGGSMVGGLGPVFVKLGGSVITDKSTPYAERPDVIARLAKEIHHAHEQTEMKLLVGHGGGSYPHTPASRYRTHLGLIDDNSRLGVALVQDAAARLNRIVVQSLLKEGEKAVSVQPSCAALSKNGRIVSWDLCAIKLMMGLNLTPVPYGDVSMDVVRGCSILSTEELFYYLGIKLKPVRVLVGSDVDGIYDKDPKKSSFARKIPLITVENVNSVLPSLGGANTVDVTGGMRSKVLSLLELAKATGVECEVLDISKAGNLEDALNGKKGIGTIIRGV